MHDEDEVDRTVLWRDSELNWGLAHADVHGLGRVLERRIAAAREMVDDEHDTPKAYIISATETEIANAVVEVNWWISDRPQGASDADGFQKALAYPPRGPDGGAHDNADEV